MLTDLRVISGRFKRQRLVSPKSSATHPMGAREKNALFNKLSGKLDFAGAKILDLFAGSGALGIEALSRGATEVVFVDNSAQSTRAIKANLARLSDLSAWADSSPAPETLIFQTKADQFLAQKPYQTYFDAILADPPYDDFNFADFSQVADCLKSQGIFVLSSPAKDSAPELPNLKLLSSDTYARARISIYQKLS